MAQLLLDRGANVNARDKGGRTPLHNVAGATWPEVVGLLLSRRADPRAADKDRITVLHEAVMACQIQPDDTIETIKQLLAAGANINARTVAGQTPLFWSLDLAQQSANAGNQDESLAAQRVAVFLRQCGGKE